MMTDTEQADSPQNSWMGNRDLVVAWLLALFPVGLFAVWRGPLFDRNWRIGITLAVILAYLVTGPEPANPGYVFLSFPAALVVLWRSNSTPRKTLRNFAIAWGAVIVVFLVDQSMRPSGYGDFGGSCAAVITEGNCTYYRDTDCNVIGRQCN